MSYKMTVEIVPIGGGTECYVATAIGDDQSLGRSDVFSSEGRAGKQAVGRCLVSRGRRKVAADRAEGEGRR